MADEMQQSADNKIIPMTSVSSGKGREVRPDVYYYTNQIVNIVLLGDPAGKDWVLIDAGMPKSGAEIIKVCEDRFGPNTRPAAIVLTHGHFDHVGSLVHLLEHWQVPVFAHPAEFPFLTGAQAYPEPDVTVEGGMLAKISSLYPNEPINVSPALQALPPDGTVPFLTGWRWIPTPGHSPGQVALFRDQDHTLISADAIITVKQDSFYKVLIQKEEVCGPPVYLTTDWPAAYESVKRLAALQPLLIVPGHGSAMAGEELAGGLNNLVQHFQEVAVPDYGRFVPEKD
jgi:glyoxylase-like metal-dependent hydrolase (beta-lactamase superfamily II)